MIRTTALALALALLAVAPAAQAQPANPALANVAQLRMRYIVNDVPSSVAFYSGNLGFKVDMAAGPTFAALSRGGLQLLLSPVKGPGGASQPMPDGRRPEAGGWNRIVLYTADLKGDVARLKTAGVHFRGDIIVGLGGSEVLIDDPSGNPVELFQPG
jgi:catechol 2,3-dioxygenase-like lactoylglutathione lyase family enzyme